MKTNNTNSTILLTLRLRKQRGDVLDSKRTLLFVMSGLNQEEGLVEKLLGGQAEAATDLPQFELDRPHPVVGAVDHLGADEAVRGAEVEEEVVHLASVLETLVDHLSALFVAEPRVHR